MMSWDQASVEKCFNKITSFVRLDSHIIKAHPKNPRKGADLCLKFKAEVVPEILSDVLKSLQIKIMHGDKVDERVVTRELLERINSELVKFGVAMIAYSDS